MPDMPNVQLEILEYVLSEADGPFDSVNLREFAAESEYSENRVGRKAGETGVLTYGVSVMQPWYEDESEVKERIEELQDG